MNKISMLVAAVFTFVSSGALAAVPKAAETPAGSVVSATAEIPPPKTAVAKKPAKKAARKGAKKGVRK